MRDKSVPEKDWTDRCSVCGMSVKLTTIEYLVSINNVTAAGFLHSKDALKYYNEAKSNWRAVAGKNVVKLWIWTADTQRFEIATEQQIQILRDCED